jgi:hypothetical protein
MSNFNPVKPGDLITAAYFNQVLGSFDTRISNLEASIGTSGAIVITGLSPSGPLHMGDTVTVLGQNFGLPSQVIVSIGGVNVSGSSFLPGSGNNALVFQIPSIPDIPPLGQTVIMLVSNSTSAAPPYSFLLLPFALTIPTGQLAISMTGAPSVGSITGGNSYTFVFTITASTSLTDNYNLAVSLDSASQAAGWTVATVNPSGGGALNQVSIPVGQNTTTQVGVTVTIPSTAGVTSAQVTLTVTSVTNPTGLFGSGSTTVTVGSAPPPPNTIPLSNLAATANLSGATVSGTSSITLPHGTTSVVVAVTATPPNAGSYSYTEPTFDDAGWVGNVVKPTTNPFPTTQANQPELIQMQITAVPAGPASTKLHFQVQSTTQASIIGQIAPVISVS